MKKKLLALLLSGAMILSLTTPVALAEEPEGECCGSCGQVECVCPPEEAPCEVCGEIECVCEKAEELPEEEVPGAAAPEIPEEPTACEICGEIECECEKIEEPEVPEVPEEPTACEVCGEIECICEKIEEPVCECGGEGCELCAEKPEIDFDADAAYEYLMGCETTEEMDDYAEENFVDDGEVLFSAEQWAEILDHYEVLFVAENATELPAVNYDTVAPLVEAAPEVPVRRAARLMTTRNTSSYGLTAAAEEAGGSGDNNGLELSKTVAVNEDGGYTLTLEAYTTGTVTEGQAKPSDIILVVDLSTSMRDPFYSYIAAYPTSNNGTYYAGAEKVKVTYCSSCRAWTDGCKHSGMNKYSGTKYTPKTSSSDTTAGSVQFYTQDSSNSRLDALKTAATSFIGQVADQNTADNIAIVGFGQNAYYMTGGTAADAFLDATSNETALKSTINGIVEGEYVDSWFGSGYWTENDLESATEHGKGLANAVEIFAEQTKDYTNRNKIVVMLTDGVPAPDGTDNWSSRIVKQAIEQSYLLKNTHKASVYTISVMPGTNASNPTSDMDKYMDYVSSNYPNARYTASSIDNVNNGGDTYYSGESSDIIDDVVPGTKINTSQGSFYLTAGDIDTLNSIFGQIADQTGGAAIELGASTVIRDIVSDSFKLPNGASTNITVTTMDATYDAAGVLGWTTSTLTGTAPSVSIDTDGKTINVTNFDFEENFVAVNGRTEGNVAQSGDFHGRKIIIEIPIVVKADCLGGKYIPTNDTASAVYNGDTKVEAFPVPHVDIPTNITVKKTVSGGPASTFNFKASGYNTGLGTYQDIPAGAPTNTGVNASNYLQMNGKAVAENEFFVTAGTPVTIPNVLEGGNIIIEELDAANYDTVVKVNGTPVTPNAAGKYEIPVEAGMVIEFINTYKNTNLTIQKQGCNETLDPNQTFIFTVIGAQTHNNNVSMTVVVSGNGSVTIKDIPIGQYKVTEEKDWSWRYTVEKVTDGNGSDLSGTDGAYTITAPAGGGKIVFQNKRTEDQWLDGNNYCQNIFDGNGTVIGDAIVSAPAATTKEDEEE